MTRQFIRIDTRQPFELTPELERLLAKSGWIASLRHADDAQELRPDLNFEQCREVLQSCLKQHNAEIGINWDVIRMHVDDLFPGPLDAVENATGGANV